MGQTLENGVYLPSEGERNCYAGLKTNWEILDQKVADVTALQQAVAGALHREIVESLPTTDIDPNTIYMILSGTSATENVYNEFMYVNNAWELIGTSATDLTNYYTKADVDGKLLLKANASDLTSHTGDTTIHVTASDKNKWNNQTYVFRYSSTALVASSTNSNTLLDNTDNLKVGDKVIDSSGVLFSITAIDTANSTFTIGTALIDLAQDSDVVHKSGDETIGGVKTFSDNPLVGNNNTNITISNRQVTANGFSSAPTGSGYSFMQLRANVNYADSSPSIATTVVLAIQENAYNDGKNAGFYPNSNNIINLGISGKRWANVYATNYYYGGSEIEFSQKFVTTDTAQTISGNKTFSSNVNVYNSDSTANTPNFTLRSSKSARGTSDTDNQGFFFNDKNNDTLASLRVMNYTLNGSTYFTQAINTKDTNDQILSASLSFYILNNGRKVFRSDVNNDVLLGYSSNRWKDFYTYLINGITPSSLSLPSNTGYVDISSYFTNTGDGQTNSYTASANGWIYLNVTATRLVMQIRDSNDNNIYADMRVRPSDGTIYMTIPINSGNKLLTQWFTSSSVTITTARFIPCQGNV